MTRVPARRRAAAVAVLLALPACSASTAAQPATSAADGDAVRGTAVVLAAASLTDAFTTLGASFEAAHPDARISFSFASSATLAAQIRNGAPADVYAAANEQTMRGVVAAGLAEQPATFATNRLTIAVPAGNPGHIAGLADFADPARTVAVCASTAPCGAAAVEVFERAGVVPRPDTVEPDVRSVLQKVAADEVDAALVYRTDVLSASDRVDEVAFAESAAVVNSYPIAVLSTAPNPAVAGEFVDHVLSADAGRILREAGFGQP